SVRTMPGQIRPCRPESSYKAYSSPSLGAKCLSNNACRGTACRAFTHVYKWVTPDPTAAGQGRACDSTGGRAVSGLEASSQNTPPAPAHTPAENHDDAPCQLQGSRRVPPDNACLQRPPRRVPTE